jgi:chitin disaccharide deacetylase
MPARLILNADDFGLTPGINRAIGELHRAGVLTSATLMATGPAFDDAVAIALANPALGVGCHLVFADGMPVSHPESIPTLLGADGKTFRPSLLDFLQALFRGRISEEDVAREASAQIQKLQRAGIDVTHIDSHKHTHIFPSITRPLLRSAESTSVRAIRNPFEQAWSLALGHGSRFRRFQVKLLRPLKTVFDAQRQIRSADVLTTDATIGISATGNLNAATLREILQAMPATGTFELCCHPGYNDADLARLKTRLRASRETELRALLNEVPRFLKGAEAPALIHYGQLGPFGALRSLGQYTPATGYERVL